jgi:hypothetical protein
LRDRFVVGAGGAYSVSSAGGVANNNLSHNHAVNNHTHHIDVQFTSCVGDCEDGAEDGDKHVGSDVMDINLLRIHGDPHRERILSYQQPLKTDHLIMPFAL